MTNGTDNSRPTAWTASRRRCRSASRRIASRIMRSARAVSRLSGTCSVASSAPPRFHSRRCSATRSAIQRTTQAPRPAHDAGAFDMTSFVSFALDVANDGGEPCAPARQQSPRLNRFRIVVGRFEIGLKPIASDRYEIDVHQGFGRRIRRGVRDGSDGTCGLPACCQAPMMTDATAVIDSFTRCSSAGNVLSLECREVLIVVELTTVRRRPVGLEYALAETIAGQQRVKDEVTRLDDGRGRRRHHLQAVARCVRRAPIPSASARRLHRELTVVVHEQRATARARRRRSGPGSLSSRRCCHRRTSKTAGASTDSNARCSRP